ncbi:MAG: alpha/beta fold hydrolase [Candidatus Binatia bacterium]
MITAPLAEIAALPAVQLPDERNLGEWLLTRVGSTLDGLALQAMRLVIDALMMPPPEDLPAHRASAAPFLAGELWADPRRFFSFVDEPAAPLRISSRYRRSVRGGTIVGRELTTAYRPYHCADTIVADKVTAPDKILVEHWSHEPQRGRGTIVALHGFSMGYPRIDAFALFATPCFGAGFDVALVTLPFHGPRTPPDARFSGERFAIPHVARLNEAVRQAIYEIHVVTGWLRQQTGAPVGLLGLSLGGYLSALMAGLRSDLDFVIPMVPPVCIGDLASRFFAQSRYYRRGRSAAFSYDELRAMYRVHSPLTYARCVEKSRILILAGRGDQIVPPEHPHALWHHWGEPEIYWFSGSHLAPFRRGLLVAKILEHLERTVGG